jgi:threonyl-tRNA synthetase
MIHRAPFGSLERFIGILIEHFEGAFPTWLAPEQVRVLTVSEKFNSYGDAVLRALRDAGVRARLDASGERLQAKIKTGSDEKIPYLLIVGGKDAEAGTVSVRRRGEGDLGALSLAEFLERVRGEVSRRELAGVARKEETP